MLANVETSVQQRLGHETDSILPKEKIFAKRGVFPWSLKFLPLTFIFDSNYQAKKDAA